MKVFSFHAKSFSFFFFALSEFFERVFFFFNFVGGKCEEVFRARVMSYFLFYDFQHRAIKWKCFGFHHIYGKASRVWARHTQKIKKKKPHLKSYREQSGNQRMKIIKKKLQRKTKSREHITTARQNENVLLWLNIFISL